MTFLIPTERLVETETLVAFYHPSPGYAFHVLLVPRRDYATLIDAQPGDADLWRDLYQAVQTLVVKFNLEGRGYRLIANGGKFQDFPHLHFHLIAD